MLWALLPEIKAMMMMMMNTVSGVAKGAVGAAPPQRPHPYFLGLLFLHRAGILTDAGMCKTFLVRLCRSSSVSRVIFIVVACAGWVGALLCHAIRGQCWVVTCHVLRGSVSTVLTATG